MSREVKRRLQRIHAPDELEAQRRAWPVIRAAFEEREHVIWPRRRLRPLLVAAAAVAVLAAGISPPGRALVRSVRDAIGKEEKVTAQPALTSLPAPGVLLVDSGRAVWLVRRDGSKRRIGPYSEGAWSPHARFVAATRGHQLLAVDPKGVVRWSVARSGAVHGARWSPDGYRIAYLSGRTLRVIVGDGTGDAALRRVVAPTAPAWRPRADHELAFATLDGRIQIVQADSGQTLWRTRRGEVPQQLVWSGDGRRLLALGERALRVLDAEGRKLWAVGLPIGPSGVAFVRRSHRFVLSRFVPATGQSELVLFQAEREPGEARSLYAAPGSFTSLAMAPNGRWLLVGWSNADQWLFLRLDAARVRAVSGIAGQFSPGRRGRAPFPSRVSWCCPASP